MAEGEAKGKGERLVLARQLARRFGVLDLTVEERLAVATPEQLETWADRILTAQTLAEVFSK